MLSGRAPKGKNHGERDLQAGDDLNGLSVLGTLRVGPKVERTKQLTFRILGGLTRLVLVWDVRLRGRGEEGKRKMARENILVFNPANPKSAECVTFCFFPNGRRWEKFRLRMLDHAYEVSHLRAYPAVPLSCFSLNYPVVPFFHLPCCSIFSLTPYPAVPCCAIFCLPCCAFILFSLTLLCLIFIFA